jgi:putative Mn2+ efflux pump MntP
MEPQPAVRSGGSGSVTPSTEIASVIILGIGANTENLPVGFAYGLRRLRIGLVPNLLIAAMTTVAALVPLSVGRSLRGYVPTAAPDVFAGLLLIGLGVLGVWLERRRSGRQIKLPASRGSDSRSIDLRETLALSGALSMNNIGLGFAGGVASLGSGSVALSVAGFSVTLLWLGEWLGRKLARPMVAGFDWLQLVGNLLLVAVGIVMMLGV